MITTTKHEAAALEASKSLSELAGKAMQDGSALFHHARALIDGAGGNLNRRRAALRKYASAGDRFGAEAVGGIVDQLEQAEDPEALARLLHNRRQQDRHNKVSGKRLERLKSVSADLPPDLDFWRNQFDPDWQPGGEHWNRTIRHARQHAHRLLQAADVLETGTAEGSDFIMRELAGCILIAGREQTALNRHLRKALASNPAEPSLQPRMANASGNVVSVDFRGA